MQNDDRGSVTRALDQVKSGMGKSGAVKKLWDHTMSKLLRKARTRLPENERQSADEEDIALSAFQSFYKGVVAGKFPELNDRNSLLKLLYTITKRKANAERARNHAGIRDVNRLEHAEIEVVEDRARSHEFAAELRDELRFGLEILPDDDLREVALLLIQGLEQTEVAARLGCSVRSVQRKQKLIRQVWEREGKP
jgi:DNA-directed RNA polymerase specialized sigma24 family protein